ncbi:MAG: metal-dependent protease - like protein [Ignavibacteria bacterium]|nr:MAG: metal-dependent protease - like protein [Ignavibacteria bacterium]KAF0159297.1 MAG: metal-dependent protease - like protein [Ignavibacteria bacterium]
MTENISKQPPQIDPEGPKRLFSTIQPATAAFIALIGIFIAYQIGGAILTLLIIGSDFKKADVNQMRLLTMGGQIMLMLLPTLLLAKYVYPFNITQILRANVPKSKEIGLFILGLVILTPLLQSFMILQNSFLETISNFSPVLEKVMGILDELNKMVEQTYGELLKANNVLEASFVIFVVAVVPSICEEVLFRGFVQKSFEQKFKPYFSIFITSLFFGLYHFNPYGLVALIVLGFYFGYAAHKSDSIVIPMILHFINNFLAVMAFFVLGSDELIETNVKPKGSLIPQIMVFIFSAFLFVVFILYLNKNFYKAKMQEGDNLL